MGPLLEWRRLLEGGNYLNENTQVAAFIGGRRLFETRLLLEVKLCRNTHINIFWQQMAVESGFASKF